MILSFFHLEEMREASTVAFMASVLTLLTFVLAASVQDLALHCMCCTVCLLRLSETWNILQVLGDLWKVLFA